MIFLKAKLENIERKYAKLKRRHDNLVVVSCSEGRKKIRIDVNGYKREDFTGISIDSTKPNV